MRDGEIINTINQAMGRVIQGSQKAFGEIGHELAELRSYMTAETIRRQVVEDILIEAKIIDKEKFDVLLKAKINEFQAEVDAQIAERQAENKEPAPLETSPRKVIYSPDGGTIELSAK